MSTPPPLSAAQLDLGHLLSAPQGIEHVGHDGRVELVP